jgi:ABC-type sugar transport system permease subunit
MLLYIMITSIIGGLQIFDVPKMFPEGMADYTRTMVLYMYESAFKRWQFGYGASIAYGIFMIIAAFSLITLKATRGKGGDLQ